MKITFGIITLNEERNLERCLSSIKPVADEILVVDSGSTDRTRTIALTFGAVVHEISWPGYVIQKNNVLALASNDWVFSLDADEALSPELLEQIRSIKAGPAKNDCAGFSMPRCVLYDNRWIRHGDWYPDRLTRLFRKSKAFFTGGLVHERLVIQGPVHPLSGDIEHHSFQDTPDHFERCRKYARLWAQDKYNQGRSASWVAPFLHSGFRFFRGYFLKLGFLDGPQGFRIAAISSYEVYLKYSLLRELGSSSQAANPPKPPAHP